MTTMTEAHAIAMPRDGWTVADLDGWPESHVRYELTDGALTVSPSPSSLHQAVAYRLCGRLEAAVTDGLVVTQAVEVRFTDRLTRIPDVLVVRSAEPGRHWFAPAEVVLAVEIESPGSHVEDRVTKPTLYARHGIPHFWRLELQPIRVRCYRLGAGDGYREAGASDERLVSGAPAALDLPLTDLLPPWAR